MKMEDAEQCTPSLPPEGTPGGHLRESLSLPRKDP